MILSDNECALILAILKDYSCSKALRIINGNRRITKEEKDIIWSEFKKNKKLCEIELITGINRETIKYIIIQRLKKNTL